MSRPNVKCILCSHYFYQYKSSSPATYIYSNTLTNILALLVFLYNLHELYNSCENTFCAMFLFSLTLLWLLTLWIIQPQYFSRWKIISCWRFPFFLFHFPNRLCAFLFIDKWYILSVCVPLALTQKLQTKVHPRLSHRSLLKVIAKFPFKVTVKLKPLTNHSNSSCNLLFNCNFSLGWPAVALHMDLRLRSWSLSSVSHTVRFALCVCVCVCRGRGVLSDTG